jgi:hypothetical protein
VVKVFDRGDVHGVALNCYIWIDVAWSQKHGSRQQERE